MSRPTCTFKELPRELWNDDSAPRRAPGPAYGDLSRGLHPLVRCPRCNRRLRMRATYCIGGEFAGWVLPDHNVRVTRRPGPRRLSTPSGRGK